MNKLVEAQKEFFKSRKALKLLNTKVTDIQPIKVYNSIPDIPDDADYIVDKYTGNGPKFSFKKFYLKFQITYRIDDNAPTIRNYLVLVDVPKMTKKELPNSVNKIITTEINDYLNNTVINYNYTIYIAEFAGIIPYNQPTPYQQLVLNKYTYSYGNTVIKTESDCVLEAIKYLWKRKTIKSDFKITEGLTIPQTIELAKKNKRSVKFIDRFHNVIDQYQHDKNKPFANLIVVDHQHIEINPASHKTLKTIYVEKIILPKDTIPHLIGFDDEPKGYILDNVKYVRDEFIKLRTLLNVPDDKKTITYMFEQFEKSNPPMKSVFNMQVSYLFSNLSWGPIIKTLSQTYENCYSLDLDACYYNVLKGNFKNNKVFKIPIFDIDCQIEPYTRTAPGLFLTEMGWVTHIKVSHYNLKPTKQILARDYILNTDISLIDNKDIRNAILGNMQKQARFYNDTQLFSTLEEALRFSENVGMYKEFYTSTRININEDTSNYRPVIATILEVYHILIEDMIKEFTKRNITVHEIRTDAFLISSLPEESFKKEFLCKNEGIKIPHNYQKISPQPNPIIPIRNRWKTYKESDIPDLVKAGKNFLVLGPAGSGKSTHIRNIDALKLAYTNTAAENINGKTIDSIILNKYYNIPDRVIIDEITQVPMHLMKEFYSDKFKQIIGFGDPNQLGAMLHQNYVDRYNLHHDKVTKLYGGDTDIRTQQFAKELFENLIILETVHRTKEELIVLDGNINDNYEAILCYSQKQVKEINDKLFKGFKIGDQIQHIRNHKRYVITKKRNGVELTPINKNHQIINITIEELKNYTPSYALTIYSSQGQEYDKYAVYDYESVSGKSKYVVDTRRKGKYIFNLKI